MVKGGVWPVCSYRPLTARRTMCDVEIVAHSQAPHSASDAGGDALPPQVSHPSRCAPVGGWACQKLSYFSVCRDERAEAWQMSLTANSNQSAAIQHVLEVVPLVKQVASWVLWSPCSWVAVISRCWLSVENIMLNVPLKQTNRYCEFPSSFTLNTARTAVRQLFKEETKTGTKTVLQELRKIISLVNVVPLLIRSKAEGLLCIWKNIFCLICFALLCACVQNSDKKAFLKFWQKALFLLVRRTKSKNITEGTGTGAWKDIVAEETQNCGPTVIKKKNCH